MIRRLLVACLTATVALAMAAPARAGALIINNIGSISDSNVLGAIDAAIATVTSLYSSGNGAGNVVLDVNFTYNAAPTGDLASSSQALYGYDYTSYINALIADSQANPTNTNLATAVAHLADGNTGNMAVTYGQALLLAEYGLAAPAFAAYDSINISSSVSNWNFTGTTTSGQYDAIGAIEHELDELLGIGGAGSALGQCSNNDFFCTYGLGATDLYRYSGSGQPSTSLTATPGTNYYLSLDGGATPLVDFNITSPGDYGDFAPSCGPSSGNSGNNQYIQNAFNCTGADEPYTPSSPEFVAATAVGWTPVPEPASIVLLGSGVLSLAGLRLRKRRRRTA